MFRAFLALAGGIDASTYTIVVTPDLAGVGLAIGYHRSQDPVEGSPFTGVVKVSRSLPDVTPITSLVSEAGAVLLESQSPEM